MEYNMIEDIIKLSNITKLKTTTLVIEYFGYLNIGLQKNVALQYMNFKYNKKEGYKNVSKIQQ